MTDWPMRPAERFTMFPSFPRTNRHVAPRRTALACAFGNGQRSLLRAGRFATFADVHPNGLGGRGVEAAH